MIPELAAYTIISAAITADSGAGGLSNSTGSQYIRGGVFREGDNTQTAAWPKLYVGMHFENNSPFPQTSGYKLLYEGFIRFTLKTKRPPPSETFTAPDAVLLRLFTILNDVSLSATSSGGWTWTLAPMRPVGRAQLIPGENENLTVLSYSACLTGTA